MSLNVDKIIESLEEELEVFSINHDLKDETYKELTFVVNSFTKYLRKEISKNPKQDVVEIIKSFDETLEILLDGIFGTSISPFSVSLYKELPTLKKLMGIDEESINKLKKENETLKKTVSNLESKVRQLEEDLADERRKTKSGSGGSSSASSGCGSYGSYGGCFGGSRSYGRC